MSDIWIYEAATSAKGDQTHAMTRVAAGRARIFAGLNTASALCGSQVRPIESEFDQSSTYACGNCKRVIKSRSYHQ